MQFLKNDVFDDFMDVFTVSALRIGAWIIQTDTWRFSIFDVSIAQELLMHNDLALNILQRT